MANIVLDKILSGYNLAKINNNFEKIENIINEILVHKDGYNALSNSLDINGQKLLNVGDIEINGQSILEGLPALIEGYNEVIESIGEYEDNIQNILDNAIGAGTAATLSYTNKQAVFTVDEPAVALSELELPHYYTVGTNSLRLSINGSVWYRGKDFDELGSVGSPSNSIKLLKTIPSTSSIEIWIDAQNDQAEYVSHITKAASVMEEYSPSSLENFVSAMDEYKSFNTEEILNNAVSTLNVLSNYNATANNTLTQLQAISTYIASAKNDVEVSYTHINDLYRLLMDLQESGLDLDRLEESVNALTNVVSSTNTLLPYISAAYSGTADYTSLASAYKNSAYADKNIAESNRISTNYMMDGTPAEVSSAIGHEGLNISAMYTSTSELFTSNVSIHNSVENLYNDTDIATSQAATYAELAGESYNNISNLTTGLEGAVEEAQQLIEQASAIHDSINLDQEKSRLYAEGTDEELLAYGIEDVEHSAKVWNLLVQESAEEIAGFDVQNYYTKEEVDNITEDIEDQLPSFINKNGTTTIEGSLHFETTGHDIIDVDKVPSGDYRDIVFKNSDGTKRIAVTRISNLANGGKEISFAPINNANAFGKSFVVGMDSSDNFYVKADNSTVVTEDNIEDYLPPPVDTIPSGLIAMWSGAANAIPSGWYLCDGSNGTPDLRDRFIVGAGNSYTVGATGGSISASASVSGTTGAASGNTGAASGNVGATSITVAQLAAHTHNIAGNNKPAYNGDPNFWSAGTGANIKSGSTGSGNTHTHSLNSHTHTLNSHTHTMSGTVELDTRSPYYALCFIMKG